ncbi:CAP domain-containing protein [Clostridium cylindrosporum]|uniref:Putative sporulation protein YkwD n=1 Tax=Clostridium cylindrosporum DSM 605 TaxID=1121307 RepID=A0A0J8FZH0_CLOCY|nr:CAP domain-containing protein [Clostridium cylindrosporum]KMT20991.1 putative sporulation protein YkwD [Clostridium cylindrosporum DSM 605]
MKNSIKKISAMLIVGTTLLGAASTAHAQTINSNNIKTTLSSYNCNLAKNPNFKKNIIFNFINKTGANTTVKIPNFNVQKPVETPAQKPAETPAQKPAETPAQKPAETPAQKPAETPASSVSALEAEVGRLVNVERQKAGLKPLTLDTTLSNGARAKSQDMADKNYFDHNSPTYGSPFDMMKKFGISYSSAGENIAMGQPTAQEVMTDWMNSPGHRANILSAKFGKIGVGYVIKNGTPYWTQWFTN